MDFRRSTPIEPKGIQLPDDDEFREKVKTIEHKVLRKANISKEYKCISKMIGKGQMGVITKVRCLKDDIPELHNKVMICKMINLKEKEWY